MGELPAYRGIHHIGITVPDLAEAEEFFLGALGCTVEYREGPYTNDDTNWMALELGAHSNSTLISSVIADKSGTVIELLEYQTPGQPATTAPPTTHNSACHVALTVDNVQDAIDHLAGDPRVKFLRGPSVIHGGPTDGLKWIYCVAPWGLALELMELPEQLRK